MVLIRKKKKKSPEELEAERQEKALRKSGIQDEFQAKGFELVTWVQHHKQLITIGIVVLALIGAVWGGYAYFKSTADHSASADYEAALELYDKASSTAEGKDKLKADAMAAFKKISEAHAGKGVGRLADLYVGHLALESNNAKEAVAAYNRFIDAASKKDQLRLIAQLGLANAYEATSDAKKALETYEGILQSGAVVDEAMVLWQASRLAKETGQDAKAKEFAAKLAERYPTSAFASQAQVPSTMQE